MYNIGSIGRYIADKFIIYLDDKKIEDNALIEGIIQNTKLLTNDKMEYDNLIEIFRKRLDIFYSGNNSISKALNSNAFIMNNTDSPILKLIDDRNYQERVKSYSRDISKIMTSLFMYSDDEKIYNGVEITNLKYSNKLVVGTALNNVVNEAYTLMMQYNKFFNPKLTPNDIINKDMRENIKNNPKLRVNNYIKMFNLVRLLLIASENKPSINYNKIIKDKKSPINSKIYNSCGDKVVPNDLLYAGKYGKAAKEYHENFDKIINYKGAFECLLNLYDSALDDLKKGKAIDKDTVKRIISLVYEYYGSRYLLLQKTNAFTKTELDQYKSKFKSAVDGVCKEYGIYLSPMEISIKNSDEAMIEKNNYTKTDYFRLKEVKENFEVQDKISDETKKRVKKLLKQCDLK